MESFLHLRKIQLKTVFKHLDYRSVLCIAINTRVTKQALKGRMKYYNWSYFQLKYFGKKKLILTCCLRNKEILALLILWKYKLNADWYTSIYKIKSKISV